MRKWIICLVVIVVVGASLPLLFTSALSRYVRARAISTLQDRFDGDVEFGALQVTVYPLIRISGENLILRHHGRRDIPPLIRVKKFSASAEPLEPLRSPSHVQSVRLEGLVIELPRHGHEERPPENKHRWQERPSPPVVVDEIVADNTELFILPKQPEKPPLDFQIHQLTLHSVGLGRPASFHATLSNPRPKGEIDSSGFFGPWQRDEPRRTPVSGTYTFTHADLGTFRGLGGILSSQGKYEGVLERIEVEGETDTPDFTLHISGHPVPLHTQFNATVDGTNGDTFLRPVRARILHSLLIASGGVVRTADVRGRTVFLDVTAPQARIEDFITLVAKTGTPPMTGDACFKAKLEIPPGENDISDRLRLNGQFGLTQGHFTKPEVQEKINTLSHRGQGEPNAEDADNVVSNLQARFVLRDGVTTFSNLTFSVPGAAVRLGGNYTLRTEALDFRGSLRLRAKVSQTTTGVKSFFLKAIDPLFKGAGAGTVLPITVTGTEKSPSFKVEIRRALTRKGG